MNYYKVVTLERVFPGSYSIFLFCRDHLSFIFFTPIVVGALTSFEFVIADYVFTLEDMYIHTRISIMSLLSADSQDLFNISVSVVCFVLCYVKSQAMSIKSIYKAFWQVKSVFIYNTFLSNARIS